MMSQRDTVGSRLRIIMNQRKLKQVDILNLAKPYFKDDIKISKTDLSQYVNDRSEPRADKLNILSKALNVQQQWLLGYGDSAEISKLQSSNTSQKRPTTYKDLGLPYKGVVPDDVNDMYRAMAETYAKNHNLPRRDE